MFINYERGNLMNMNEQEIIKKALNTLELNTDIETTILEVQPRVRDLRADARIKLENIELLAEIKNNILRTNIGTIINQLKNIERQGNAVLIGTYINDNLANLLRETKINYIDTVGNAYIKYKQLHIHIKGNTAPKDKVEPVDQAFTPNGLKVIYALLTDPKLAKKGTQREIADQANVALGAVGKILQDLIKKGFLKKRIKTKERYWNKDHIWKLIDKWVEAYPKLRKKQFIGRYTTNNNQWWKAQDLALDKYGALLGGEIAAEEYTRHLKPEIGTVYLDADKANEFLKAFRLAKTNNKFDAGTTIELLTKFWAQNAEFENGKALTHPLITYADLVTTGDVRNIETANIIKEDHLIKMVEGWLSES